jgi:hypothetical protein
MRCYHGRRRFNFPRYCVNLSTEAVVIAGKETGLEGNAEKTKDVVMCRDQNTGQIVNIHADHKYSEAVEQLKHLGGQP